MNRGHVRSNLVDGYGGPQDPAVRCSVDDVARDLEGTGLEIAAGRRVDLVVRAFRPASGSG